MNQLPQVDILGVEVNMLTMSQAVVQLSDWIEERVRVYVSPCNVYSVMQSRRDARVRQALQSASLVTPDGMPLVWMGKWAGPGDMDRVSGPDLMLALCRVSVKQGYSHFFYGGAPGVPQLLASKLQARFPGLNVVGTHSPPFSPSPAVEETAVIERINRAAPDIVWVGLGAPKQDLWMAVYRKRLDAPVLIGVGAAFDFHSGRIQQAPTWMQRLGLEWLHRLLKEPKRLWYRYLVYNPQFALLACLQLLGIRRRPLEAPEALETNQ
jgi:N-acetylglucosaminyldiphosphoundecaprenol N-acetyl-beta-D-mannosaminyltransferase